MLMEILFVFTIVSIAFYGVFLYILIKHRNKEPFNSPLFTICIFLGVQDIVNVLATWTLFKLPMQGWFDVLNNLIIRYTDIFGKLFTFLPFQATIGQQIGMAAVAMNRYTAICRHFEHDEFWTRKLLVTTIVAQFVGPLPITVGHTFLGTISYPIDNITGAIGQPYYIGENGQVVQGVFHLLLFSIFTANNLMMLVLYGLMFRKIRQHLNHVFAAGQQTQMSNTDKKLAFFGFSTFVLNLFSQMSLFVMVIFSQSNNKIAFLIAGFVATTSQDVLAYSNPWFMLVFCKVYRKHVIALIKCQPPPDS